MRHTGGLFTLALLVSSLPHLAHAQDKRPRDGRPDVFRMDIINGGSTTVRYFGAGLSPSEGSLLREMEDVQNQLALARDLTALSRQYVASERLLEPIRRQVQQQLYGLDVTTTSFNTAYAFASPYGTYAAGVPGFNTFLFNPWLSASALPVAGTEVRVNRSLANGVGDQGPMKDALAKIVAGRATPEAVAALERSYDRLARRAGSSEALRAGLRLPRGDGTRLAADEDSPVTLTLKGGDKVRGDSVKEAKDWFVVSRPGGGEVRVRASEVVRVETTKKGVVPAAGD